MWAVLPVKNFDKVKTRLATVLTPAERSGLFGCMVHDVIAAVCAVPALEGVLVVSRDPQVRRLAASYGAEILEEDSNDGHNVAIARAACWLSARGKAGFMQIPGDIPTVTAQELSDVLAAHRCAPQPHRSLTIAPSRDYGGSNCIVCAPPDLMTLTFGEDSFRRHLERARAESITHRIVEHPGIGLDIDEPADLRDLAAMPGATRTHQFMAESGIAKRVLKRA